MNLKKIISGILTVLVVAIMVGLSELLGEREIIFPEITAIAIGLLIAPKRSWQVSRIRILILISVCSVLGLIISLFVPLPLWLQMSIAFIICQIILIFSKTSFAPLISAAVLPVMLGTKSIIYPVAAITLTGLILLCNLLLEKLKIKENEPCIPQPLPHRKDYIDLIIRSLTAIICITLAIKLNFYFAVAPPVLVAFTEFTRQGCKVRQKPVKAVVMIFICALTGTVCRYILTVQLGLLLTFSAVTATVIMILILHLFKMYLPPAGALTILAMLIPEENLLLYPFEIFTGISVFMVLALLLFRNKHKITS